MTRDVDRTGTCPQSLVPNIKRNRISGVYDLRLSTEETRDKLNSSKEDEV